MIKRQKTIRVVGAAILKDDHCLVTQRAPHMGNPLEWEFPGGKVEPAEDPRQALVREIREELAVEITVGEMLGTGTSRHGDKTIELEVYIATLEKGEIRLAEHQGYGWFAADEVDLLEWSPADQPLLGALKHRLGKAREL